LVIADFSLWLIPRIIVSLRHIMSSEKKHIAILGSTGSIGTQALDVIAAHPEHFQVEVLSAQNNADLLIQQAIQFKANSVVIGDESKYEVVKDALWSHDVKVYAGKAALNQIVESGEIDCVLTALVGAAGLEPTVNAIKNKKTHRFGQQRNPGGCW
jgi:1-deoxy-D-xylulose-5-phosphate reductoisomerase